MRSQRLPDADRERTRASVERVRALSAELSKALAVTRFGRTLHPGGGRGTDLVAGELQLALTDLASGPLGAGALDALRPKSRTARRSVRRALHRDPHRPPGRCARPRPGPAVDPAAARVKTLLDALRAQHRENDRMGVGLLNLPAHAQVKAELVRMGSAAVPPLIDVLGAPRPDTDTPEGLIEDGVADDIAEVLGAIGDPEHRGSVTTQCDSGCNRKGWLCPVHGKHY